MPVQDRPSKLDPSLRIGIGSLSAAPADVVGRREVTRRALATARHGRRG
jgi:hypothetical protein